MKTIISLTTMPDRLNLTQPVIDSLLNQDLDIYLWMPKIVHRTGKVFDGTVPAFMKNSKIHFETVEDEGSITKLLPALRSGFDRIITADDDVIYPERWARRLIKHSDKWPDSALCYRGRTMDRYIKYNDTPVIKLNKGSASVNFLTGTHGALYKKEFFKDSIYEEFERHKTVDDAVISAHLRKNRIPIKVISVPPNTNGIRAYRIHRISALWKKNNAKGSTTNDDALKDLGFWDG